MERKEGRMSAALVTSPVGSTHNQDDVPKMELYLCGLPPKATSPQDNHEKDVTAVPTEGHSITYPDQHYFRLSRSSKIKSGKS